MCANAFGASANEPSAVAADSLQPDSVASRNIIYKIIDYFKESNKPPRHEGMDFSIIGGPHYSSDTKLGLGLVAAGLYYMAPATDTITHVSNLSFTGDITTGGFYKVGIEGNHFSRGNNWRIDYQVDFYSFLRHFWGIGYDKGAAFHSYAKFTELQVKCHVDFYKNLGHHFFIGPSLTFTHLKANDVKNDDVDLWCGQRLSTCTTSAGIRLLFDSRDNLTATQKGYMLSVQQGFCPRFLGNKYAYSFTEFTTAGFWKGWRQSVIAVHLHGQFNYGEVPWGMLATFGGSHDMRGYYQGRFRDKCAIDATLEVRQHLWRRHGVVGWVGAGTVFPSFSDFKISNILPNAGIGYRWEFKKNTNVRLDYGIGRGESSFIFSINEAF